MKLEILKIDQIKSGDNVRKDLTKESLSGLIASIKDKGIIQPILVRKNNDNDYDLVAGYRRYNAAKHLNLSTIPSVIMEIEDNDRMEYQVVENLQRQDLNPIDEALSYKNLSENHKIDDLVVITGKPADIDSKIVSPKASYLVGNTKISAML